MRRRAVVVGAGLAGLSAAVRLADAGLEVTVLERGRAPGGRARAFRPFPEARPIDWGQHLLIASYRHTLALVDRLGSRSRLCRVNGFTRAGMLLGRDIPLNGLERLALLRAGVAAKVERRTRPIVLDRTTGRDWLTANGQGPGAIEQQGNVVHAPIDRLEG